MALSLMASWFVCALGAAVFAAAAPLSRAAAAGLTMAFLAGSWWGRQPFAPSTAAVGLATALVATLYLTRRPSSLAALSTAGLLAGLWLGVLEVQGIPLPLAAVLAIALPLLSARSRQRQPDFAPPALVDEALLFLVALGVAAAATPGVTDGWHAAANLNLQRPEPDSIATTATVPAWTLAIAGTALVSGGAFSLWSRR